MDQFFDWDPLEKLLLNLTTPQILFITALALLIYVSIWGLIAIWKKRGDLADIAWGPGFLLVAWISFLFSPFSLYSLTINLAITVWALRLAIHIFLRNRKRPEDFRYQNLKKEWGHHVAFGIFFKVFILQGVILYIISLPIVWINTQPKDLSPSLFWMAIPLWLIGFLLEAISDYQLVVFQRNSSNRGKLLKTALWSYVRHPNYLGEIVQWWAIWLLSLSIPLGWALIISPLLITFLIVKVSGVAPLEEKMRHHPHFPEYAKNTPSLIPFPLINGTLYSLAWFILVFYGFKVPFFVPLITLLLNYTLQLSLLAKFVPKGFLISIPLSLYALFLGLIQETLFIHFGLLAYPGQGFPSPFWLLSLYPLFSLTLNSSLQFLNQHLSIAFFLGGAGSLLSYFSGEQLGAVQLNNPIGYPLIFFSWGCYLTILILLNRKLIALADTYTDREKLSQPLTVFFDTNCPICSREMAQLKKRKQTGAINYASLQSDQELKKVTNAFSYKEAMEKIHAIDSRGGIHTGIDVFADLYARTDLPILSIALQAPGFRTLFKLAYAIWAKLRKKPSP